MMARRRKSDAVSASALSQMAVCERLVMFERCGGKCPTPAHKVALRRGLRAHRRFASEDLPDEPRVAMERRPMRRLAAWVAIGLAVWLATRLFSSG